MLKRIIFSILFVCSAFSVWADYDDCMTKAEAEDLAAKVNQKYIIDYCDCCDKVNPEADKIETGAKLIKVTSAKVVVCDYDETRYSVEITFEFIAAFDINKGKLKMKTLTTAEKGKLAVVKRVSLNYHFYTDGKKAYPLYDLVGKKRESPGCGGISRFPTPEEINDKGYQEFIRQ